MSVSFNELAYRVFTIIIPQMSDDQAIDISEIKYDVENSRALLIKRSYSNKFKSDIPDALVQSIKMLEIMSVNASNSITLPSDKVLMRTVLQVPDILEKSSGMPMIKRISASTILSNNFSVVTPQQAIYSGNGKFNQDSIFCFIENKYIYLVTKRTVSKALKYIDLYPVFSRPSEYYSFMNTNYSGTYSDDSEYPITMDMIDDIESIIVKNKLKIESTQPIDAVNDSSDTIKQVP